MPSSNLRALYKTVVQIVRAGGGGGPGRINGATQFNWVNSTDIIDPYWGVPGQMKCRLDVQFVRPGMNAAPPEETASVIPRTGTLYYDIPESLNFVKAGDHLIPVAGTFVGSVFRISVIPEPAQGPLGPTHMEAQIVEIGINTGQYPKPGDITR